MDIHNNNYQMINENLFGPIIPEIWQTAGDGVIVYIHIFNDNDGNDFVYDGLATNNQTT